MQYNISDDIPDIGNSLFFGENELLLSFIEVIFSGLTIDERSAMCMENIEDNGKGLQHYIKELNKRNYVYGRHVWPHDGAVKEWGSGMTRLETALQLELRGVEIQPKMPKPEQIQAGRTHIPIAYFNSEKCERGLECLTNYQKVWDEKLQMFKESPKKDWSSHGADGFMYSALDNRSGTVSKDANRSTSYNTDYNEDEV